MNRNKMIWGGLGVIVVAVVAVAIFSPFPPKDDLSGAVGVAKQYRAEQITDADVVLQDPEIQDLLQSDFFYKLATDKEFRKVAVDQLARMDIASGRTAQFTNPASLADMDNFLAITVDNAELRTALAEGRMEAVNKILVADGKVALHDAANRVFLAESRNLMSGRAFTFAEMKVFLDLAKSNVEMRQALTEGRMDIVHKVLIADGKSNLADVANRVYISLGRGPAIEASAIDDMRSFVDLAAGNSDLRVAFTDGRMDVVNKILVADGKAALQDAAGRVYFADGRGAQIHSATGFADMKLFLEMAKTNVEMRNALADGRMDIVNKILIADGKTNLVDTANRIYLSLGRHREVNIVAIADMRAFVEFADGRTDLQAALADGRMDVVNKILVTDGKVALHDAAGRVFLTANRAAIDGRTFAVADMRVFLDLAKTNVEMRQALADGRMDIVNKVLVADGKTYLADAANRVYVSLGRNPELNAAALDDMRSFIDAVGANADLKAALADGRLDIANKVLMTDGKAELQDAAGRVVFAVAIRNPVSRDYTLGSMRAVSSFAAENGEFRQALQDGRIEMAARVARAAGRSDISLRGLQVSSFVVGDSRSFATDLGRLVAVADTPTFKQAAENPGWGRMLATTDAATWKQTVEAAGEGKFNVHN